MGRLRPLLPVPSEGEWTASFPGGMRLRLDAAELVQRDYLFGLYERLELRLVRRLMSNGRDFVDVGAHIGFYTVAAALACRDAGGRVLAFEPNPVSRTQLLQNLRLNDVDAEVVPSAASDRLRRGLLRVPNTPDTSWSSLEQRTFVEGEPYPVEMTTIDAEVQKRDLRPAMVKIDVEGHELAALQGMRATLAADRPVVVCEVGEHTAEAAAASLAETGYRAFRVWSGRLRTSDVVGPGTYNVLFVPEEKIDVVAEALGRLA